MHRQAPGFDLISTGRIGVDLYPLELERSLAEVTTFAKSLGGSPTNVAVAAARLGCRAAVITKVGADGFGDYLRSELERYGVDARWVGTSARLRTPVVFCEIFPPDRFPLLFYREPSAPDLQLEADELDLDAIAAAQVFWTTGTGLCEQPSRDAVLAALAARDPGGGSRGTGTGDGSRRTETIHDLDYRPMFWETASEARRWGRRALAHATIAVGNREEVEVITGERDDRAGAEALLELGPRLAIVKRGSEGVYAASSSGEQWDLEPVRTEVLNGLGAGDAFGGALCVGIARGWEMTTTLQAANAAGAIVASRLACAPDMPTLDELERAVPELAHA